MKKMPPRIKFYFERFLNKNDRQMPNLPSDWKPFYHFIHAAHQYRAKLLAVEVEEHLKKAGFHPDHADRLALVYEHGRSLLKAKPALNYIWLKANGFFDGKQKGR